MSRCKTSTARHRFPPSVIQHAVWLYYRFNLSVRDVEDLLAERNITFGARLIKIAKSSMCIYKREETPRQRNASSNGLLKQAVSLERLLPTNCGAMALLVGKGHTEH
ncbi:MAG: transposase-like protein [Candidatus Azotimanducaceae bacterium]|jgi:transposase-like protein